ncbi:MAG: SUMF1/EgtB/PvdO family nonheme iron enzyme [Planctomycetota bacterium]
MADPPEPDPAAVDALFTRLFEMSVPERRRVLDEETADPVIRERVRRLLELADDPPSRLDGPVLSSALVESAAMPEAIGPYAVRGLVGVGAMGAVYRAEQRHPRRAVAVKILRRALETQEGARRFELEAQFLGRLQHPAIAQIFEAGTAAIGGVPTAYIAMELVDGKPITRFADERGLDVKARVELLVQLAGAVHHAQLRGVIHRDLKPSNVLVNPTGEVKVIDFGVARATGRDEGETSATLPGQVIGTLAYMSPEQLRGDPDAVDTRTDVYSLGVIAYELLSGRLPYPLEGANVGTAVTILLERDAPRLGKVARPCRGDLERIVEHALEKAPERRYQSAIALADDLRRFLDGEAILARRPSAIYQISKLARRNRGATIGLAATLLAILVGAGVAVRYALANKRLADHNGRLVVEADTRAAEAERQRGLAEERAIRIARTAAGDRLDRALREAELLWPAVPARVADMDKWLEELGEPLGASLASHRAALASIREQAEPYGPDDARRDREQHPDQAYLSLARQELEQIKLSLVGENWKLPGVDDQARQHLELRRAELEELVAKYERGVNERTTWRFAADELQEEHDDLTLLVRELTAFTDPAEGMLHEIRRRRSVAVGIYRDTVEAPGAAARWDAARAAIAESPHYGGMDLEPQPGLIPLDADPQTELWEFWHVTSGTEPTRSDEPNPRNPWRIEASTGLVLVLVPGGTYRVGAQSKDPTAPHYDPAAVSFEGPVREVELRPYFLSKYEITQSQYERIAGENPSGYGPTFQWFGNPERSEPYHSNTEWNPVEYVSWNDATLAMQRAALRLPSLEEWEVAARGGTQTPWWTGATADSLADAGWELPIGNLGDALTRERGGPDFFSVSEWDDEFAIHAPVGSFAPNPLGFFDIVGNVSELCSDHGIRHAGDNVVAACGGSYQHGAANARVTAWALTYDSDRSNQAGVRPARSVE